MDRVWLGLEMSCSVRELDLGCLPVIQSYGGADCALLRGGDADLRKIGLILTLPLKDKRVKQPRVRLWLINAGEPHITLGSLPIAGIGNTT